MFVARLSTFCQKTHLYRFSEPVLLKMRFRFFFSFGSFFLLRILFFSEDELKSDFWRKSVYDHNMAKETQEILIKREK